VSDPFATGQQVADLLGSSNDAFIARAAEAAAVVTATMRAYCRQTISLVEDDTAFLIGTAARRLLIPERPVRAVAAVGLDGYAVTDYRWTRAGALWRDAGWGGNDSEIEVTFDHGFDPLPDDLVQACRTATARLCANTDGLVRFEAAGEVAETYSGPWGFTIAELIVLNRYRRCTFS
jgi:hypothetical protein